MVISTVRTGKTKMVVYLDGKDLKTIQSKDEPAPEFNDAWDNLALDIKMALATQLGVETAKLSGFTQDHKMEFTKIHYEYSDDEETPFSYDVWGHHTIVGTDYDTDVKLHFRFGEKGAPDKAALDIREEARKYVAKYRGQTSLFEDMDQEENGGDKDEG